MDIEFEKTPVLPPLSQNRKDGLVRELEASGGLYSGVFGDWVAYNMAGAGTLRAIKEMPTYEVLTRKLLRENSKEFTDFIIANSAPEKVRMYNEIIARFNAELPAMKEAQNSNRLKGFSQEIIKLRRRVESPA